METTAKYAKVVVIGLDGADWRLLNPWIASGYLPTLAQLVDEGTKGKLRSTIRPESSAAWSSFSTGVNPGKHGVFSFVERVEASYEFKLANAASVRVKRFWDILGAQGLKVGMLNIPFTYPPSQVNGFMVTGMLTPGVDVPFTYPSNIQGCLLDRFGNYVFDTDGTMRDKQELVEKVRAYTWQQRESALLLLREQPWDFFAMVFTGPDRLQHFLWSDIDPQHPFHAPQSAQALGSALLAHYKVIDDAIATILSGLPANTLVLLMSDHGFNGCARRFYVNRWLQAHGFLTLNESAGWRPVLARLLSQLGSVRWLRRLKRAVLPEQWSSVNLQSAAFARTIDWSRTKAYFGLDGGLRINLRGREPAGIVQPGKVYESLRQELRSELLKVADPETNHRVLSDVFFRETLYDGPFIEQASDLILEPQRNNTQAVHNIVLDGTLDNKEKGILGSSMPYSANHTLDGIFVARGQDVANAGLIQDARIIDLAPTVLASLGVAVPDYMDGRVLSGVFLPDRAPTSNVMFDVEIETPHKATKPFTPEEEAKVESRLRDLGYLD